MKRIVTSIWFLSLVISIPIILFLPDIFSKYKLDLVQTGNNGEEVYETFFKDLDSDGEFERIISFQQRESNRFCFHFYKKNGGLVDQINFPVQYSKRFSHLKFADADADGNIEVYTFSIDNDSIILNWIQVTPEIGEFHSLAICEYNCYQDSLHDYSISPMYCHDLDGDGKKELIFSIVGGYSLYPRQIFKVDIASGEITKSEKSGSANLLLKFDDLNGDGKLEIIADGAAAPVRDWTNLSHNDPAPYLKIFNSELEYFIPPIKFFEGIQSQTFTYFVNNNKQGELVSAFLSSSSDCIPLRIYRIDIEGNKLDSLDFKVEERQRQKYVIHAKDDYFITQVSSSSFLEFSKDFKKKKVINAPFDIGLGQPAVADINNDGIDEMIFFTQKPNEVYLCTEKFKWIELIELPDYMVLNNSSIILEQNKFFLTFRSGYQIFTFKRNSFYFLKFPFYLIIFFTIFLLIYLLQEVIETRIREKYEVENQIRKLQLQTFRNQLDPHFIFNTFNTIASVIKQGRKEEAYEVFMKFSKLFRVSLENSEEIQTSLSDEVGMIINYIDIQNFRFKDVFEFENKISPGVNMNVKIPKMLIQVHIENAVRHGLKPRGDGGKLKLNIKNEKQDILIEIEDNGVGRVKAKELKTGNTGLGLKTMGQFVETHNKGLSRKIKQEIIDLFDSEGKSKGTKVRILVPNTVT